jgi:hypothetical protein
MFTTGEIVFAVSFFVVFVVVMLWSYKKDSISDKIHFKGASKTLLIIILVFLFLILYVKMRNLI